MAYRTWEEYQGLRRANPGASASQINTMNKLRGYAGLAGESATTALNQGARSAADAAASAVQKIPGLRGVTGGLGTPGWAAKMAAQGVNYGPEIGARAGAPGWVADAARAGTSYGLDDAGVQGARAARGVTQNVQQGAGLRGWLNQPAGQAVERGAQAVGRGATAAARAAAPYVGGALSGAGAVGLGELAAQGVIRGAEAAGLAEKGMTEDFNKSGTWFPAIQGSMRALAYGAGRGLNKLNSDWGITDSDVASATKHGISIFDDKSGPNARAAQEKKLQALKTEMQQARDQGAPERGAVVGTTPEAKGEAPGQLVVPRDEDGNPAGEPYFNIPSIAPRLRDATAQEAAELPIGNKTRQTMDFGRLGSATFAYDPEREARMKRSMQLGMYDQTPRVERAVPDGKGGFKPSGYALNPTNPERLQQGIKDYETVERGTQAMRDLRATRLGLSPEMLNAYDQGTPLRTLRAAETKRGIEAPYGPKQGEVTKQDLDGLKQAFAAALKGGEKKGGKEEKLPEAGEYFHETLKRLTGSEEQASRIMRDMLSAGYQPKDAAGLAQAVERHKMMSRFMANPDDNPYDLEVVSGTPPGFFFDGDLTVANRKSGRQKVWDEDNIDPDSYNTLLRRLGLEP